MRRVRGFLLIIFALAVGYSLYPYLNRRDFSATTKEIQVENEKTIPEESSRPESRNQDKLNGPPAAAKKNEEAAPTQVIIRESGELRGSGESSSGFDTSKRGRSTGAASAVFSGSPGITRKDFSYYIQKNPGRLELSPNDPRLELIQGTYEALFEGQDIRLNIGSTESSLRFLTGGGDLNEQMSLEAKNEVFFSNHAPDGNLLLIEKGELKYFLDLKEFPRLRLRMGRNSVVGLRRIRGREEEF